MSWRIALPIIDPFEVLTIPRIAELVSLVPDEEDRLVTRQLFDACHQFALASRKTVTIGVIAELLESLDGQERRATLDFLRWKANLEPRHEVEARERVRRAMEARFYRGVDPPMMSVSGAIIETPNEDDLARQRSAERSLQARREHERIERAAEVEAARARAAARDAMLQRELPEHLRR